MGTQKRLKKKMEGHPKREEKIGQIGKPIKSLT